nr:Chain C, decameric peptide ligand from the MART-1/Melan-A [synthetic construct]3HG1_C Chain C, Cancer/mart-1 [Homo sapiens]3QDG_C Chain C, Mart-1 (26-35) peptide [synthetic construct]3QDM_C Chain C, MART-1(27-35) peptide [synthetic construct]4JFF_C Chain C, Melanoma motif [Homo sapiens]4L3E_C Chain C, Melanoma antigen recognized by T-cells 1 [Homo sapiens]5E9D_C Chain C, Melanoma derived Mart-1 peptide [Homo sapiens]5E9D_H Chain H, Melanoma derived Mart-1 peptide [Homo sapiens]5NHT_P Cha
ELAGIGILTV